MILSGQEISTDLNTATVSRSVEVPDASTFQSQDRKRLPNGIFDWNITFAGLFNDNTGAVEERAHTLLGASSIIGVFPAKATTACTVGYEGVPIESDYNVDAPVDGVVAISATWTGSGDIARTYIVQGLAACSTTGSLGGNSRDFSASRANVTAVLRCTTASGTTPTLDVVLQHSGNDSVWSDVLAFTQVTAGSTAELRTATGASRYMRAHRAITGTGADFTYMVTTN